MENEIKSSLKNLWKTITKISLEVFDKGRDYTQMVDLSLMISKHKKEQKSIYKDIGQIAYELMVTDDKLLGNKDIANKCNRINEIMKMISSLEEKIKYIKNKNESKENDFAFEGKNILSKNELKGENEKKILSKYEIDYFYHMTHIKNINGIIKDGLYSHNQMRGVEYEDISDNEVNNRREKIEPINGRPIHDYVPFYFSIRNPMYRRRKDFDDLVILLISSDVIFYTDMLFTDGNAASKETKFYHDITDLGKLDWECLTGKYWNNYEDGKRKRCAEVLLYKNVLPSRIMKIYCKNENNLKKVKETVAEAKIDIEVTINKEGFFV